MYRLLSDKKITLSMMPFIISSESSMSDSDRVATTNCFNYTQNKKLLACNGSRDRITKTWPINLKQDFDCSLMHWLLNTIKIN